MPRTPVLGLSVRWRPSTGHDDLLLVEGRSGLSTAVALVGRRAGRAHADEAGPGAVRPDGEGPDPEACDREGFDARSLPVGDVDMLVADLRRERLGDRLVAEASCAHCSARIDIDFSLTGHLRHHRPRPARSAVPADEPGWWRLRHSRTWFRLPTAGDVLAAGAGREGHRALVEACVRGDRSAGAVRAAERAMASLGPTLRGDAEGTCPECAASVSLDLDVRELCLEELVFLASGVLDEVHLLASAYHWQERDILDLPSSRRIHYAERVRASWSAETLPEPADA
ncbi:hypothetical protein GCM10010348_61840 [Streptomyces anthocyanicus]|uniref:hypothetical protein n=1 Tax=Streptomyces anthocyanicus TaxID=68174 RepID=UPI0018769056|nr:hypothetical protein [Streptomyces anthocyanicus]GHC27434.1 hypothetical protein GCM10010348_61840 [Streptomyces anthocyanicus]